jgi:hypothetical protein
MAVHVLNSMPPLIQVGIRTNRPGQARGLGDKLLLKTALIDTGAMMTAIVPPIISALRPRKLGNIEISRPGMESLWAQTYDIRVAFEPDPKHEEWWLRGRWFNVEAIGTPPASVGVDVLIGQDTLSQVVMSWDGPRRRRHLMYQMTLSPTEAAQAEPYPSFAYCAYRLRSSLYLIGNFARDHLVKSSMPVTRREGDLIHKTTSDGGGLFETLFPRSNGLHIDAEKSRENRLADIEDLPDPFDVFRGVVARSNVQLDRPYRELLIKRNLRSQGILEFGQRADDFGAGRGQDWPCFFIL